jgi:1-aminocyclopropane-1-carboxylate deaminase/D-cysteine desulfhydrase-like pyridoxal-dependent ACC family enzyme
LQLFWSFVPRVRLANLPTPLEHLPRFGEQVGHPQLYIKRDDLISLGLGGNKVRHLEFWLGEALEQEADVVIACGLPESNQCRLTAAAAAKLGLECRLLHNADRPKLWQGNLLLNHLAGAKSIFLGPISEEERHQAALQLMEQLRAEGRRPYLIGNVPLGALGYANAALELQQQADQAGICLEHVVIVGAMGATAAGFLYGTAMLDKPWHVHVISVEYDKATLHDILVRNHDAICLYNGFTPCTWVDHVMTIYDDYLGPGYAIPTPESLETVFTLARTEGIFLESVYTSKTVWGLADLVRRGIIPPTEPAAVIHTGGTPALFGQAELFQPQE